MPEKPPQNLGNIEESKTSESELSPEVLEKVMAKAQDINEWKTAVHALRISPQATFRDRLNLLNKILKEGLLGNPYHKNITDLTKENWARAARERRPAPVCFNIMKEDIDKMEDQMWLSRYDGCIALIFDLKNFKGKFHEHGLESGNESLNKTKTFRPDPDYGYELRFRVAPRNFTGIIFNLKDLVFKEAARDENNAKRAKEIAEVLQETYKDKPQLILPIYDVYGNLYWPKQMSYKEVKKFVEERNKSKKEEKDE